jgi:thiamine-phosphate pyrophosphorylase
MNFRLPQLYPITDRQISGLSHALQVQLLAEGGATLVQLRDKLSGAREFYLEARDALDVAHKLGVKLIINDRADIAHALQADGVHLGQEDMPVSAARELLGPHSIVGVSTHNLHQLDDALNQPVDYIAFGPIFSTLSKGTPDPVVGIEGLRNARKKVSANKPLVAIGGITLENAREVWRAGADSVAMIRALLDDPDQIISRVQTLIGPKASGI